MADNSRLRLRRLKSAVPYVELMCAVAAAGLWYMQGGAIWYAGGWPGPWPLMLLAIALVMHLAATGFKIRITAFDIPLWIFLATAGVGVWAAYDPGPAWAKFWLVVGAIGLYYTMAHQPDLEHLYITLSFFGLLGVALSAYFFATNDWEAFPAKVPALVALGKQVSAWVPSLSAHRVHPNVMGGMLATLMPVYVPLIKWKVERGKYPALARRLLPGLWVIAAGVTALGWLTSASRGAWLAVLGVACLWIAWRMVGRWSGKHIRSGIPAKSETDPSELASPDSQEVKRAWQVRLWIMAGLLLAALPVLAIVTLKVLSSPLPAANVLSNRLELLRTSWLLARDTVFTGAGLGMFQMQFSIYTLLIHVGYILHSHNIFMDILIEQGAGGLIAFAGLAAAGIVWGLRRLRTADANAAWIIEAGLASLVVILVHGLVDDALYGSRGLLLLFVPFGIVAGAISSQRSAFSVQQSAARTTLHVPHSMLHTLRFPLIILAALAIIAAICYRPILGAWYADLGAVEQSRVELSHYDQWHFDNPTMDQVRQRNNLDAAIQLLKQATQIDPANPTAPQRLAAIELSRGQYAEALAQMQAAWNVGHRDPVTRLLLGDACAANGQPEQAAELVRGLRWAKDRLAGQAWARYWVSKDYQRAADAWAAVVLLNPNDQQAAASQAEAARLAKQKKN